MITSSSLNESILFDCLFPDEGSVILLLLPLDVTGDMLVPSILSDEFLGPSEMGDLMDSLRGCLVNEALIDRGMHFECPEGDSPLSSCGFNSLYVLHICVLVVLQMKRWPGWDDYCVPIRCQYKPNTELWKLTPQSQAQWFLIQDILNIR